MDLRRKWTAIEDCNREMMSGRKQLTSAHYRAFRVKHFAVFRDRDFQVAVFRVRVGVIYALNLNT